MLHKFVTARQDFLEPGEGIVMISRLKKIQKLTNKKVQLILTDKPKLLCVDPSKMTAKANIIWSDNPSDLHVQVANPSHFKICTVCFSSQVFYHIIHKNLWQIQMKCIVNFSAQKGDFIRGCKTASMAVEEGNWRPSTPLNLLTTATIPEHNTAYKYKFCSKRMTLRNG